ncbi:MAG: nucleotidyl transferase AbiEii/AbiGii toxin family protein [Candidatus Moraniibacteriota bacterium]|nr:MAG: nucleotidyl transferase AbiEii/AbiGii toxin family protein [Candidatus Moranbacteria bacterium]
MLNREKHELVMTQILKDVYADTFIGPLLGFKGGTAAYLFYGLERFSVDLDFDLLEVSEEKRTIVFDRISQILLQYGTIRDSQQKENTIFLLLSYGAGEYGIKVEVNTRKVGSLYEMKQYFGIPMLVMKKESMFASKLIALIERKKFAARDMYDVYYFLKNNWDIDINVLNKYGKKNIVSFLDECIHFVENTPDNSLLGGLGELVEETKKDFIRNKMKMEIVFFLSIRKEQYKKRY